MVISRTQRVLALGLIALGAIVLFGTGHVLSSEDQLQNADAIYVLGGSWVERGLEATDLLREGRAPHIVISNAGFDNGLRELERRGVQVTRPGDAFAALMTRQLGVPADAVEVLPDDLDNTAQEADAMRGPVATHGWKRLIVITDRASTRRAGFAMRRALGSGVEVIMRAPRLDPFSPGHWWRRRADVRAVIYETPKLLAYWLGLRG